MLGLLRGGSAAEALRPPTRRGRDQSYVMATSARVLIAKRLLVPGWRKSWVIAATTCSANRAGAGVGPASPGADVASKGEPSPGAYVAGGEPSPCADVAGARTQSRCRCGWGEPSPGADVDEVSPVHVQMWMW